ncbi:MAG: TolC family protein [Gemmatimonadales bacterium]|jgi:outer membrane protein TolC|nr:TolC family protein [Gemmatimonadales bacterium]MBT3500165.1 TolC family protein [Gemmatimonadales bacterium]MBT3773267.1 TolC family protein [Gemmatimonadales bacterium]MBT3958953.1 TolC family protein [Gemmatimonadales bacterium]MBT4186474.1 TolC family protein [Gemmatimonadales bacterium]
MVRSSLPTALLLGALLAAPAGGQETSRILTLGQALEMAREGNPGLNVVRQKVEETRQSSSIAFTNYLPQIRTQASYLANNNTQGILLPAGSLGYFSELGGKFPRTDRTVPQGGTNVFFALTTITQPLTHYFKIREGRGVLRADEEVAGAGLRSAEQDVSLGVLRAYAGLLLADLGRDAARERVAASEERMAYLASAVEAGTAADLAGREARIRWLQARQVLLEREGEVDDLTYVLADAVGLPAGTRVEVTPPPPSAVTDEPLDYYVETALRSSPGLLEARAMVNKATHGVGAARAEYIPEIGILGAHLYQNSVPFFPKNTMGIGISGSWTILDFGARRKTVRERRAQLGQAESNLTMVEGRVRGEVEAAYRKLARARDLVELAKDALALRTEGSRLRIVAVTAGYAVAAQEREAIADRLEAEMDMLKAEMGYRIAFAELGRAAGILGR